jgi:hypothetical protein
LDHQHAERAEFDTKVGRVAERLAARGEER